MTKFEQVEKRKDELIDDYGTLGVKELEKKYSASYGTILRVCKKHNIKSKRKSKKPPNIKYKFINDNSEEFCIDYINGVYSLSELSEKYHCPIDTLMSFAREKSIKRNKTIDKVNLDEFKKDWEDRILTISEINEKYKISDSTRYIMLTKLGIVGKRDKNRIYYFNQDFFKNIDTEEKAYWLGFIYADGSVNESRNSLQIVLKEDDRYILDKFCELIEYDKVSSTVFNKDYRTNYAYIRIHGKVFVRNLVEKGVVQDKSFKIRFPDDNIITQSLKSHFIRGYLDGDGTIHFNENNPSKMSVGFCGNKQFLECLRKYINEEIGIDFGLYKVKDSEIYKLSVGGRFKVQTFLDYVYKESTIHLFRKYDKYIDVLKYNENKKAKELGVPIITEEEFIQMRGEL